MSVSIQYSIMFAISNHLQLLLKINNTYLKFEFMCKFTEDANQKNYEKNVRIA